MATGKIERLYRVPSDYQQVDFIKGTPRQQLIDTGIVADNVSNIKIEVKWRITNTTGAIGNYVPIFGDYVTGSPSLESTRLVVYDLDTTYYVACTMQTSLGGSFENILPNIDHTAVIQSGSASIDGQTVSLQTTKGTVNIRHLILFGNGDTGTEYLNYVLRIYYFRIYSGDTLIRDFVPCYRKSDDEPGMFDTVTQQFFANEGTGSFKIPIYGKSFDYDTVFETGKMLITCQSVGKNTFRYENLPETTRPSTLEKFLSSIFMCVNHTSVQEISSVCVDGDCLLVNSPTAQQVTIRWWYINLTPI